MQITLLFFTLPLYKHAFSLRSMIGSGGAGRSAGFFLKADRLAVETLLPPS